jgi:hypothetical protein
MSVFKTYKGARIDLQHYKGKSIEGYEFEVFDNDDTAFDLSAYDDIIIKIFEKRHGTELLEFSEGNGDVERDSPAGNSITWHASMTSMDLFPKFYYHECYGVIDESPEVNELIFHGVFEMI